MRRTCLQGLSVLHHGLDCQGVERAREPLVGALVTDDDGKRQRIACEVGVHMHHLVGLGLGLLGRCVRGVSLLPKELCGTKERTRAHLPPYHIAPLVAQDRKVPP